MKFSDWLTVGGIVVTGAAWLIDRKQVVGFFGKHHRIILAFFAIAALSALWEGGYLNWLIHRANWPVWALILLGLSGFVFALAILAISELFKKGEPTPFNYVRDEIFDVLWVWGYRGTKLDQSELAAFCPKPDCRCRLDSKSGIVASGGYYPVGEPRFSLSCPNCGFKREFDRNESDLKRRVFLEIERRINTREYVERMKREVAGSPS